VNGGPPYRRYTHGPAAQFVWKVSAWDHQAHAFNGLGEVTAEAICTHSTGTATLIADDGTAPECLGCIVAISQLVIGPANDRFDWRGPS